MLRKISPMGLILQGQYSKTVSAPLFAIQSSKSKPSSASRRKSKISTAAYCCPNYHCLRCPRTIKPYMERESYTQCYCRRCPSRLRGYKKSDIADMKNNIFETEASLWL
ncbi:Tkp3 protein [Vanderwaltozyma polyspora DSM 70294]|uniref:Tkp3 protein n=1 Tax=Vanderwaltozyma polyspora (strain ATCC 22028 / DSM 70294 / BCRC 21397 / CBS 2163 / NBRC 10782 / NRRL Y-8283 / UCD 57-17) TaxID=436907 RepID=A7TTM1_VANPO|nr:Tkp3 protein [Vanderwaltozyma polyspora DSM 70294]EDO14383.1 Tkp3 protein [Vanderwaltozyma polyspora DSM 70294]